MSHKSLFTLLPILIASSASADAFRNLGFEEANTNNLAVINHGGPPLWGRGSVADLLPGWQVYDYNRQPMPIIGYNFPATSLGFGVDFGDAELTENNTFISSGGFVGSYSIRLEGGFGVADTFYRSSFLIQQGDVPVGTKSLIFANYGNIPNLYINGGLQPLFAENSLVIAGRVPGLVGANISGFAGSNVELKFGTTTYLSVWGDYIDSISISSQSIPNGWVAVVPEPGTLVLTLVGAVVVALRASGRSHRALYNRETKPS